MALDLSAEGLKAFLFETLPYQIHVCLAFDWPDFAEPVFLPTTSIKRPEISHALLSSASLNARGLPEERPEKQSAMAEDSLAGSREF
jgi:hypothetical protein